MWLGTRFRTQGPQTIAELWRHTPRDSFCLRRHPADRRAAATAAKRIAYCDRRLRLRLRANVPAAPAPSKCTGGSGSAPLPDKKCRFQQLQFRLCILEEHSRMSDIGLGCHRYFSLCWLAGKIGKVSFIITLQHTILLRLFTANQDNTRLLASRSELYGVQAGSIANSSSSYFVHATVK